MRVTVKICGLTSLADAAAAREAGADLLGFVFFPASRRCVPEIDCAWVRGVSGARKVGVFRDQDLATVQRCRERAELDVVQLHGDEPVTMCRTLGGRGRVIKAIPVAGAPDWSAVRAYSEVAEILFDTASPTGGGTGRAFDWDLLAARSADLTFYLAGGLRPETVAAAIRAVRPAGVDVASGVEVAVGVKDAARMRAFVAAVRGAGGRVEGGAAPRRGR